MDARRERLRELMDRRGLDAWFCVNFAWFTSGADNRVDRVAPEGVADIVLDRDGEWVSTTVIEAPRMRAEQVPQLDVREHPWHRDTAGALRDAVGDVALGADLALEGVVDVSDDVARLRRTLDPEALHRARTRVRAAIEGHFEAVEQTLPASSVRLQRRLGILGGLCRRRTSSWCADLRRVQPGRRRSDPRNC
jgi:hypothetical protein